jgi:hypothetical protein
MPVMPRPRKAKKISDFVMKKNSSENKQESRQPAKPGVESRQNMDIRTMIKR